MNASPPSLQRSASIKSLALEKNVNTILDVCRTNINFPTLMGSVGGWVFVLDVTRGERRKIH